MALAAFSLEFRSHHAEILSRCPNRRTAIIMNTAMGDPRSLDGVPHDDRRLSASMAHTLYCTAP